jgi:phosphoglycerate dehydrogenase-like enzyme
VAGNKMKKMTLLISFDLQKTHITKIQKTSANVKILQSSEENKLMKLVENADILLAGAFSIEMFRKAKKLKWIQTVGAGVNRFIFPEVVKSPVIITSAGGVHPIPVSEHVIGLMLSLCRKLHFFVRNQTKRKWERDGADLMEQVEELSGKTVGVVGLGRIGNEVAKKAKCLGMKVIATKRNPNTPKPDYIDSLIHPKSLKELLAESDFVVITVPLTTETERMIGETQLRSMKKTSYLINVARGKIVQENKMIQALKEGWIAGAGLDTFEAEPLSHNSELWDMKNVIITPHVAGLTPYYFERLTDIFCANLNRFMRNEPLINVVDKTKGY